MGAAPTDHQRGALVDFKQGNDAISFLLEEACSGCHMQSRSEGAKVRMERCHCRDSGLNRRWPELTEYEEVGGRLSRGIKNEGCRGC